MKNGRYKAADGLRGTSILVSACELLFSLWFYFSAFDFERGGFSYQVLHDYGGIFMAIIVVGAGILTFILDGIAYAVYPCGVDVEEKNAEENKEDAEKNAEPKRMFPVGFVSALIQFAVFMLIINS